MANEEVNECMQCGAAFGFFRGRHHCRRCGGIFCDACSQARVLLPVADIVRNPEVAEMEGESSHPQRVCRDCEAQAIFAAELKEEDAGLQHEAAGEKRIQQNEHKEHGKQKQEEEEGSGGLGKKDDEEALKSAALALLD